jgi:hypothetical protein
MEKRGISTIVVTIILVALSLVAIGVVWAVISNIINSNAKGNSYSRFTVKLDVLDAYTQDNNLVVRIKRNAGGGDLKKIKFVLSDQSGSELIVQETTLKELETDTFSMTPSQINLEDISKVSIVPVILDSSGSEMLGDVADTFVISENVGEGGEEGEQETGSCGDGSCLGTETCGTTDTAPECMSDCGVCNDPNGWCGDEICATEALGERCSNCQADCGCEGGADHCVSGSCVECIDAGDCDVEEICTNGVCVPENCPADPLETTCLNIECGNKINNCGTDVECPNNCDVGEYCNINTCEVAVAVNTGIVDDSWPGTSGMYFGSSSLPTEEGTDYMGYYVSYTHEGAPGDGCHQIAHYTLPVLGYPYSHIRFNFETDIQAGDVYSIWNEVGKCPVEA